MARPIDRDGDDREARLRFHISSARMATRKMSYVAFQRYLDRVERSMYRCRECGWRGLGRELQPMQADPGDDQRGIEESADTWYACPRCEAVVDPDQPALTPVAPGA